MDDWQGPQWVLATLLLLRTVTAPLFRVGLIRAGATQRQAWPEWWGKWLFDLIARLGLVAILAWGGFF